jgi:hypothetical protein
MQRFDVPRWVVHFHLINVTSDSVAITSSLPTRVSYWMIGPLRQPFSIDPTPYLVRIF